MSPCRLISIDDEEILQKSLFTAINDFVTQKLTAHDANVLAIHLRNVVHENGLVEVGPHACHDGAFEFAMVTLAEGFSLQIFQRQNEMELRSSSNYPSVS